MGPRRKPEVVQGGRPGKERRGSRQGKRRKEGGVEEGERKEAWRGGASSPCRLHQGSKHSTPGPMKEMLPFLLK